MIWHIGEYCFKDWSQPNKLTIYRRSQTKPVRDRSKHLLCNQSFNKSNIGISDNLTNYLPFPCK